MANNHCYFDDFVKLTVTGRFYNSKKRFTRTFVNDVAGRMTAYGINLWRGSIWGVLANGKRKLLKRVYN